jgi:hypothetical protein
MRNQRRHCPTDLLESNHYSTISILDSIYIGIPLEAQWRRSAKKMNDFWKSSSRARPQPSASLNPANRTTQWIKRFGKRFGHWTEACNRVPRESDSVCRICSARIDTLGGSKTWRIGEKSLCWRNGPILLWVWPATVHRFFYVKWGPLGVLITLCKYKYF